MRIIAVVTGEARLVRKYECLGFLDPTLPFIAHRFASRPISPVAASSEEVTADWRERQRAVENETRKCDVILAEG